MMMMLMSSVILGPFGNYLVPLMIGSKRVAFPRLEALSFWLTPAAFLILLSGDPARRVPHRLDRLRAAERPGHRGMDAYAVAFGLMGISIILAGFNIIVTVSATARPACAGAGCRCSSGRCSPISFLMVLAAPVLVGGMYMMITDRTAQTAFFVEPARRQQLPVPEPVLVLRPPRGLHPGPARVRHRVGDHPGVLPQTAVRLPDRRGRHDRRGPAQLLRLAAPPVRQRHQPGDAAAVHADHRADLDPDRVHLPGRDGHVLEGQDPVHRADAVRLAHVLQLPDRRHLRRVPVRRPGGHHRARQLLRDGPLPLHDHGRADLRLHGRPATTGCPR